ncbi:DUF982 domain-containing protein [Mesorhizobium sp. AaZ16]|uniref:DUF982 domain-containing protein n=1 Tax=Mesorhizobium sp. AaZ16 TaxID=3402289 RepID=UPI00374E8933
MLAAAALLFSVGSSSRKIGAVRNLLSCAALTKALQRRSERAAIMNTLQFHMPVRIIPERGRPVTEIYEVEEALAFLQNRTEGLESPLYQKALNCCFDAIIDLEATADARAAFTAYARVAGILARDSTQPAIAFANEAGTPIGTGIPH